MNQGQNHRLLQVGQHSSKKTGNTNSSASSKPKPKPAPAPAPNLINFDEEKWAHDDDAGWESIDTK